MESVSDKSEQEERPLNEDGEKQPVAGTSERNELKHTPVSQIAILEGKLMHYKAWVTMLHQKVAAMNPGAIKNAKKIYCGNLPSDTTEEELRDFLNDVLAKIGAVTSPGLPVLSCKIVQDKNYAFVEVRSVEEATNCLSLDGLMFREIILKIRRPSNYDLATAIMLGPVNPDPTLDLSRVSISKPAPDDSPNKIFVGGLPCDWPEDHVRGLLTPFGTLRSFNLVMDKATGYSKGYAFCEYEDEAINEEVIKSLNHHQVGGRVLTVKRAADGTGGLGGAGGSAVGFSGGGSSGSMSRSSSASMFPPQQVQGMGGNGGSTNNLLFSTQPPPPPPPPGSVMGHGGGLMMGHPGYAHPISHPITSPQGAAQQYAQHMMMGPHQYHYPHAMAQFGSPPGRGPIPHMDPQAHFHYSQQGHYMPQGGRISHGSSGNLAAAHNRPGFGSSGSLNNWS